VASGSKEKQRHRIEKERKEVVRREGKKRSGQKRGWEHRDETRRQVMVKKKARTAEKVDG
jgi:hypothetical protein